MRKIVGDSNCELKQRLNLNARTFHILMMFVDVEVAPSDPDNVNYSKARTLVDKRPKKCCKERKGDNCNCGHYDGKGIANHCQSRKPK